MKQILIAFLIIVVVIALSVTAFTINQVSNEQDRLQSDLVYRSSLLANSLKETVEPNFINQSDGSLQEVVNKFTDKERFAGLGIYDNKGNTVAASSTIPDATSSAQEIIADAMDSDKANGDFTNFGDKKVYALAVPLHNDKSVVGALLIVQNAGYIDDRVAEIWRNNLIRFFLQTTLLAIVVLLVIRWILYLPLKNLVESLRMTRSGNLQPDSGGPVNSFFLKPLQREVLSMQQSLVQARLAASEEAKVSLEKLDTPWTAERLKQFIKDLLKDRVVVSVSNLEPYKHTKSGRNITYHVPASGLITAIEPVMQSCGGIWIAQGSGDADKLVVDANDTIAVPPSDPKYSLKRVWLTEEEMKGYYYGFCDQAMYPLCHMAHTRPVFNEKDWEQYKKVNGKFAKAVLTQIKGLQKPVIFVQDFQFTLLPKIIKASRPDAVIGLFWHVPWVSAESFSICPWKKEILDGMLGADLIGFHTQLYCNNFIETVAHELECLIDYEQFAVTRNGHMSLVNPFPVSITYSAEQEDATSNKHESEQMKKLLKPLGVNSKYIGLGVDRMDYIKGVLDRLTGIELFFENYPAYRGQLTFIQISAPSEGKTKKYQEFAGSVEREVERINDRFKTKNWKPVVFLEKHHSHEELRLYYKLADFCLVTSLHDGMNLVAKEFVAARDDERGVLILSQFAGAAKELKDALIINPYNGKQTAEAINRSLNMSPSEQSKRMKKMRDTVKNYNIYRWSAEFFKSLASLG